MSRYLQQQALELRAKNVSIRRTAEILGVHRNSIHRLEQKHKLEREQEERNPIAQAPPIEQVAFLKKLKGLSFDEWNRLIGMPVKSERGALPFPYPDEWTVFNSLMQEDGSAKDRHCAWLASRGIGKSETAIRILSWLATRDDSLKGSEMMLVTGNRQALANDLNRRIKLLFKEAYLPETPANVVELNGVHIESYPASGHTAAGRGKSLVSAIFLDDSSWWGKSNPVETQGILDVIQGYWAKSNPYTLFASSPSQPGDLMDQIFQEKEDECAWHRIKQDWRYGENLIYTQADLGVREENRLLFNEMLNNCKKKEYFDCANSKGKSLAAESLFLILVFEQQKMINELIARLDMKGENKT